MKKLQFIVVAIVIVAAVGLAFWSQQNAFSMDERHPRDLWKGRKLSVQERAETVNQCFTNGTPIPRIIGVLGANFIRVTPFSLVSVNGGKVHCWLEYHFDDEFVTIQTSAELGEDPETAKFQGAGYSLPNQDAKITTH
jgi:hypothetical protein